MRPQYLIPETPLMVLPSLMKALNGNYTKAIILQQIHFMCSWPKSGVEHGGHRWVWFTYDEFAEQYMPWLTSRNVRKQISELEMDGLLLSATRLVDSWDSTKFYRVDEDAIWNLTQMTPQCHPDLTLQCHLDETPQCHPDLAPECTVEQTLQCQVINKDTDHSTNQSTQERGTQQAQAPTAPAPLTYFDGSPVEIDKSRRPTFTSRTSTRKAAPFTPRWHKVIKGFRSVDLRKFDRDGMVSHGEGCVPLEVYCEFVPAQKLTDRIAEKIDGALAGVPAEQIRAGFAEWIDRTRSKENDLDGMLDWAVDPSKRYSARNRGTSNGNQNRQQPATTWYAAYEEQQRNGAPVRTLAELNELAARNHPEITF